MISPGTKQRETEKMAVKKEVRVGIIDGSKTIMPFLIRTSTPVKVSFATTTRRPGPIPNLLTLQSGKLRFIQSRSWSWVSSWVGMLNDIFIPAWIFNTKLFRLQSVFRLAPSKLDRWQFRWRSVWSWLLSIVVRNELVTEATSIFGRIQKRQNATQFPIDQHLANGLKSAIGTFSMSSCNGL